MRVPVTQPLRPSPAGRVGPGRGGDARHPQFVIAPYAVAFWCEGTWGHPKDTPTPLYSGGVTFAVGRGRKVPWCGQPNCDPPSSGFFSKINFALRRWFGLPRALRYLFRGADAQTRSSSLMACQKYRPARHETPLARRSRSTKIVRS